MDINDEEGYVDALDRWHEPHERKGTNIVHLDNRDFYLNENKVKQNEVNRCRYCTFNEGGRCSRYSKWTNIAREECPQGFSQSRCPKCGKRLVQRKGKYGNFYGCSGYPECKFTVPLN